jgi:hypothetical protein
LHDSESNNTLESSQVDESNENKEYELIVKPSEHFDSHKETSNICFKTLKAGTYAIVFDNKNSLLTSKKVFYTIRTHIHGSISIDNPDLPDFASASSFQEAKI